MARDRESSGARLRALVFALALLCSGCAAYGPAQPGETIHRNIVYAQRGGRALRLDLYVPRTPRPAPLIVWFHGGSWEFGSKGFHLHLRELTREGFAIAAVNYRVISQARWPAQREDCEEAVRWLRANGAGYGADPQRMGLAGESAGGHLAALLGTTEGRPRIKAVCALYPPTDMVALGRRYAKFKDASLITQMFGGRIEDRLAVARDASPVAHVCASCPPFQLWHGQRDFLVPVQQSRALDRALREAGVESHLTVLPGKTHAFGLHRTQLAEVAAFFHRHL